MSQQPIFMESVSHVTIGELSEFSHVCNEISEFSEE